MQDLEHLDHDSLKGTLEALCLLLHAHLLGTRTCGEGSHVYNLASFGNDLVGALGYLSLRLLAATRVERVGCGVQYAHNHRA